MVKPAQVSGPANFVTRKTIGITKSLGLYVTEWPGVQASFSSDKIVHSGQQRFNFHQLLNGNRSLKRVSLEIYIAV